MWTQANVIVLEMINQELNTADLVAEIVEKYGYKKQAVGLKKCIIESEKSDQMLEEDTTSIKVNLE